MVIRPKVRGFVCITAHPEGCAAHVAEQVAYVKSKGAIPNGPRSVLVIGASTGYGLASRIAAAFGSGAQTLGVFFERPSDEGRPATPGWYNTIAFTEAAHSAGLKAANINGDAFSDDIKKQTIDLLKREFAPVDLQFLVVGLRDHAAIVGEGTVDKLGGERQRADLEAGLSG